MTLPHQCNDYDSHEIMKFVMVISVSRVEGIILLFFGVVGLLAFVVIAMRVIRVIRDFRVITIIIRVILLF